MIIGVILKTKKTHQEMCFFGGRKGTRTPDPLGVNEML